MEHGQYYVDGTRKLSIRRHGYPDFVPEPWMRVRAAVNHGKTCFLVYITTPKRKRVFRDTTREAHDFIVAEAERRRQEGRAAYTLTESQRVEAVQAIALLGNRASLTEAAAFWVRHAAPPSPITVAECCKKLLDSPGKGGRTRAETTKTTLRIRYAHFCKQFGKRAINELALTGEVSSWFEKQGFTDPQYRTNWHRVLSQLFRYAVRYRHASSNPMADIEAGFVRKKPVSVLSPSQTMVAMEMAQKQDMQAVFALMFFAGIRPHEVMRLRWNHVDFESGHIEIPAKLTKTGIMHRYIPIQNNLREWLLPVRAEEGPITTLRSGAITFRRKKITAALGIKAWPTDVARHSFASNRGPFVRKYELAEELGNQEEVIDTRYRKPIPKNTAAQYWTIMPPS